MRQIFQHFDKAAIAQLPVEAFGGRIIVILSAGEVGRAADYLMRAPRIGIDTETRPTFHRGAMHPVALLQVSTPDTCFLFRLNRIGLPPQLVRLLSAEGPQKIGLSLADDWHQLCRRADFQPGNYLELQDYVKRLGVADMSLQKLYANLLGRKISKSQRLTNWEADVLTERQKVYAATDAWACLRLYDEINRLLTTRDFCLILPPQP